MYPVSEAFLAAVKENTRNYYWDGQITTTDGTVYSFGTGEIVKGSGYISSQCCGSSEIELGTVYAAELSIFLDQTEYQIRYDNLTQRFETAKQRLETVMAELDRMQTQRADIDAFLESFDALPDTLTEFNLENWHSLVEYATVYSADDIRFTFKHGKEIQA